MDLRRVSLPLLSALLLALAGCGGDPVATSCSAATCSGCCDASGACQPGTFLSACGFGGGSCDLCQGGDRCLAGRCEAVQSCSPKSCEDQGKDCGTADDGCGNALECGSCETGKTCGAAGPNVCGIGSCTRRSCGPTGIQCGNASDGCSGLLECGECSAPAVCGGAGVANVCAVRPSTASSTASSATSNSSGATTATGSSTGTGSTTSGATTGSTGTTGSTTSGTTGSTTGTTGGVTCPESCPSGFSCASDGLCRGGSLTGLVLNEVGHQVSGRITVNGALPTRTTSYCQNSSNLSDQIAIVRFSEPAKGYSASLSVTCSTADFGFSTLLPPGTWDVRVERGTYATAAGTNLLPVSYLARSGFVISGPVSNLLLEELGHQVSGRITVNGALPTRTTSYCQNSSNLSDQIAIVRFSEPQKGYSASLSVTCSTADFGFSTLLPPGTWDIRVERGTYATAAGTNLLPVSYLARSGFVISGPVSNLLLEELGHQVSGRITVNGALPTRTTSYCQNSSNLSDQIAIVRFSEPQKGYSASLSVTCSTADFGFSTLLPPGTWDIRVERGTYATAAGTNLLPVSYLARTGFVISGPVSNLLLEELGHQVSGRITVNGALPTRTTSYCQNSSNLSDQIAIVRFSEPQKGYSASLSVTCSTADFGFSTLLPPGTWDIRVERGTYATAAGTNLLPVSYLARSGFVISGPVSNLLLEELGHQVSGRITVNGALPTRTTSYCQNSSNLSDQIAIVRFSEPTKGYSASLSVTCSTADFGFSTLLPPGTWDVRVERGTYATAAGTNLLPVSYLAKTGFVISGPVSNVLLEELGIQVSGRITVNGALPTRTTSYCQNSSNLSDQIAIVRFSEPQRGYSASISVTCGTADFGFSTLLPPGAWEARVERGTYATAAGTNLLPVSYLAASHLAIPQ